MSKKIIGQRVLENYDFLKRLSKIRSEKKKDRVLASASCEELLTIIEIAANILKGAFCLSARQKQKLLPFADYIRKLGRARTEKSARNLLINQKGGNAAIIGSLLAPIVVEATSQLISKIFNG